MRPFYKLFALSAFLLIAWIFQSFVPAYQQSNRFPYRESGLTDRQAAAHMLSRFSYGATPGQIDEVLAMGIEKWFNAQLKGNYQDADLLKRLEGYEALRLTNAEVIQRYPQANQVLRMAEEEGVISRDSVNKGEKKLYKETLANYMRQKGFAPRQELLRQFMNQKVLRAAYSQNQLQEVLTEFWFNHFNVSFSKNQCAEFIPAYERDVIRPNALGNFGTLLVATAKSPAMLAYLDNFSSVGTNEQMTMRSVSGAGMMADSTAKSRQLMKRRAQGLNENYAREVMELHTLGVDGGYTQKDVTEAARVLTGWTIYPMGGRGPGAGLKSTLDKISPEAFAKRGFVKEGDFLFAANRHDTKEKLVLGKKFASGEGYQEGIQLLGMLARHPATATFISRKLAQRFVSDTPPETLVKKMARTFSNKDGDIRAVLLTMVNSPEFWSKNSLREKTKSPFELAISAIRALNAEVEQPYQIYTWVSKMGQRMYYYQAPTGFPDRGQYWINTGSLLNRMNFGLALASRKIPGLRFNLEALNGDKEPESITAALEVYGKILLPERDLSQTITRLKPMVADPELEIKVNKAASKALSQMATSTDDDPEPEKASISKQNTAKDASQAKQLAQVVGVIIGSPEFQRR